METGTDFQTHCRYGSESCVYIIHEGKGDLVTTFQAAQPNPLQG